MFGSTTLYYTAYYGAGCVGFLLSVMGCVGAWREKAGLINCYAVLIAMIAVGENQCCGAEAGLFQLEPEPVKKLWLRAVAVWYRGSVLAKYRSDNSFEIYSHFNNYTQNERKNRYTFRKAKLLTLVFKTAFFI